MMVSSTEPRPLLHLGRASTVPERYGVDFLWSAQKQLWGVQRKTWTDLIASVHDDRLVREVGQADALAWRVLVVEGRQTVTADGKVLIGRSEWTREQVWGLLWGFCARGWWVLYSDDMAGTARMVQTLEAWSRKNRHDALESRSQNARGVWGLDPSNRALGLWLLQSFPGVGVETARRIWDKHGLPLRWTVGREELMQVEGIGKKKAEQIIRTLEKLEEHDDE